MKIFQLRLLAVLTALLLLSGAGGLRADPALDAYYAANALYNKNLYKLAIEEYDAFIVRYPHHEKLLNAKLGMALSHYELRQFSKAQPILAELAENVRAPHQEQVHNLLGQCYLVDNNPAEAEKAFRWSVNRGKEKFFVELPGVAQSFHESPEIAVGAVTDLEPLERSFTGLIEALFQQAKWQEVISTSDELQKLVPDGRFTPRTRFLAALASYELKQYANGEKRLTELLSRKGDNPFREQAIFLLAECQRELGTLDKAAANHQIVARDIRGPLADNALFRLGYIHFTQEKYTEARADFSALRLTYPHSEYMAQAGIYLGRSSLEAGNYTEARAVFAKLADKAETAAEATLWLGKTYLRQKDFQRALALLEPALDKFSQSEHHQELRFAVGNAQMGLDMYPAAAKTFYTVVDQYAESSITPDARRLEAFCLHRAGAYGQSGDACKDFLERWPDDSSANDIAFLKAENFFFTKEDRKAAPAYRQFIPWEGESKYTKEARFRLAQIAARNEQWAETRDELEPLMSDPPKDEFFRQLYFLQGLANMKLDFWQESEEAFKRFLSKWPNIENSDTALLHLSDIYLHHRRSDEALRVLTKLIQDYRDSKHRALALGKAGRLQYEQGNLAVSRQLFETVVSEYGQTPFYPQAEYYLGWISVQENKPNEALKHFTMIATEYADHELAPDARYQHAIIQIELEAYAQAEDDLRYFISHYPDDQKQADANFSLGVALARQQQYEQAGAIFAKFRMQYPEDKLVPKALYEGAWCARELNRPSDAAKLYNDMLGQLPQAELANRGMLELAEIRFEQKRYDDAMALLDRLMARDLSPQIRPQVLYRRGWTLLGRDQRAAAADAFETLLQETPNFTGATLASYQAGEVRLERKEFGKAYQHFLRAAEDNTDPSVHQQSLLRLGEAQTLIGQWENAEKTFRSFREMYPDSQYTRRAQLWLGWSLENLHQYEKAIAIYKKPMSDGQRDEIAARCQFQIGECYFAQARYDLAIKELVKVDANFQHAQWTARALLEIARALDKQGYKEQALARYNEVTQRFPNENEAAMAREILNENKL